MALAPAALAVGLTLLGGNPVAVTALDLTVILDWASCEATAW